MNKSFNPPHFGKDGKPNTGPQLSNSVLLFIDDILIFSKTAKDNARHLELVFDLLRQGKLQIKPSQCVWGQTELTYLGFIVRRDRIKPDPKRVEAVTAWPTPTTVKDTRQIPGID